MIKKLALIALATAAAGMLTHSALATTGIFGGYIVLNLNNTGDQFYKLDNANDTTTPSYNGQDLGIFNPAVNSLFLSGGEADTFKNSGGNVTDAALNYRIFTTGNPTGTFFSINLPFAMNLGGNPGDEDQKWQSLAANTNLLSGLAPGSYTLQTFVSAGTNEGSRFLSNGGSNYAATFTVVPEPGTNVLIAALSGVGCLLLFRRRRTA